MKALLPLLFFLLTITVSPQEQAQIPPETNDPVLPELLKDFYQSARYWKVAHIPEMENVTTVLFIKSDLNMLGEVSKDGTTITLNEELKAFPYLLRIIIFHQIGNIYGLPPNKENRHNIMSKHWEIDLQHELYARRLAKRPWHDEVFFTALANKHPIEKRL